MVLGLSAVLMTPICLWSGKCHVALRPLTDGSARFWYQCVSGTVPCASLAVARPSSGVELFSSRGGWSRATGFPGRRLDGVGGHAAGEYLYFGRAAWT